MNIAPPELRTWHGTVDTSGRVQLPAELRHAKGIVPGIEVVWVEGEKGVELRTFDSVLAEMQDYFLSLGSADVSWSDEIIRERREEAAREEVEVDGGLRD
jgi:bifunctional DNA-binding transcriptional regulator/antitoxin component of YhaV-PrlF toxin-antitoxin module